MAIAAADELRAKIHKILSTKTELRIIFAAAPSQSEFLKSLVSATDIPWHNIIAFHMDDYVELPSEAPQRFSNWLEQHLFENLLLYLNFLWLLNLGHKEKIYAHL